jgi:hypothetical protein
MSKVKTNKKVEYTAGDYFKMYTLMSALVPRHRFEIFCREATGAAHSGLTQPVTA